MSNNYTPMQQFALDQLAKYKGGMNPSYLASLWSQHKHGRSRGASRDLFGCTSAAYRTLRKLATDGIIDRHTSKTSSGYTIEEFSLK